MFLRGPHTHTPRLVAKLNLVFDGRMIYGNPTYVYLSVGHLLDFAQSRTLVIDVEKVEIFNNLGQSRPLEYVKYGYYEAYINSKPSDFMVAPGINYKIVVKLTDGRIYESGFDKLIQGGKKGELAFQNIKEEIKDFVTGLYKFENRLQFNLKTGITEPGDPTRKLNFRYEYNLTFKI